MKKAYKEYFKDPRWQKKRLKILERDEFICQACFDTETPLNVHHRVYLCGKKPWEYDNELLVTLCEDCHNSEKESVEDALDLLTFEMKKKFLSHEINQFAHKLLELELIFHPNVFMASLCWLLGQEKKQKEMINDYLNYCEELNAKRKDAQQKDK